MARPSRWKHRSKLTSGCCRRRLTLLALADAAKVFPGVDAGIVAVAPVDPDGVIAHWLHAEHLQRRLEHLKWIVRLGWARRGPVGAGTRGAGAFVAQVHQAVIAGVAILPIDLPGARDQIGR